MTDTSGPPPITAFDEDIPSRLRAEMAAIARQFQRQRGSIESILQAITETAVETVPGADHASISFVARRRKVETRAATSDVARDVDLLQEHFGEGPCLEAIWEHDRVRVDGLATETRWPRFSKEASALGVGSMLAFQLYTDAEDIGALNLHSMTAGAFDHTSEDVGQVLATHSAIALLSAMREVQFTSALATRDIIGQAKGMIMERFDIDAVQAFDMLTKLSQSTNMPLSKVAAALVTRDRPSSPAVN